MSLERSNKKLKNNIIYSSLYQMLVFIVPIITTPYVTRIFNISQMGEYSFSLSVASLFVIFSQFGIDTYGIREIAKENSRLKRERLFFQLMSIQFTISVILFVLFNSFFIAILNVQNKMLFFVQSLLILVNIFDISWYFIGIEEIKRTIFRNTMTKVFTTLTILIFIKNENQLIIYALLNVFGMLVGNLFMIISSCYYINYRKIEYNIKKKHIEGAIKLLFPKLLNSSYESIENTILRLTTTAGNVGIYAQAKKIDNLIFSIIHSAIGALSPRMSYYVSRKDTKSINLILEKAIKYSTAFSTIFISGVLAVSDDFVNFFFGFGYEAVAPVLEIISLSLIILPITALLTRGVLIPNNRDKEYSVSIIVILISGTLLNLFLSPIYGAVGAAATYVVTQTISFVYLLYIVTDIININNILKNIASSIVLIIINVILVSNISYFFNIEHAILSFIIFGGISVGLNILAFVIMYINNKIRAK